VACTLLHLGLLFTCMCASGDVLFFSISCAFHWPLMCAGVA
jgi:hypothetical protein